MTDKTKKSNEPELIEDEDLDEASGGLLPAVKPSALKIQTTSQTVQAWPSKIEIGGLKAGDGSV